MVFAINNIQHMSQKSIFFVNSTFYMNETWFFHDGISQHMIIYLANEFVGKHVKIA